MDMKLPFSTTGMMLHIDDSMDYEVLSSSIESMPKSDKTEDEIVLEAMAHPIGSPKLSELAKGKENVVIICSDHTRPVPSKHIIIYAERNKRRQSRCKDHPFDCNGIPQSNNKRRVSW